MHYTKSRRAAVLGLGMLAALAIGSTAQAADGPFLASGGCPGYYAWYWGDLYSFQAQEATPYFAHHPPVYYSLPVPRTYGYTPFPYPPWMTTPEVAPVRPKIIENHFVPRKAPESAPVDRTASRPLRIVNPYVVQPAQVAAGQQDTNTVGAVAPPRARVVYPAALAEAGK